MSDNRIIKKPVMKPATGPKMNPLTKLSVSLKPTLVTTAYTGTGETEAISPARSRTAAPIALNVETKAICFELNRRL